MSEKEISDLIEEIYSDVDFNSCENVTWCDISLNDLSKKHLIKIAYAMALESQEKQKKIDRCFLNEIDLERDLALSKNRV